MRDDDEYDPVSHGTRPPMVPDPPPVPFDEFLKAELERRRKDREADPTEHNRLQAELAKVREKKRRRRERNPYDFS